MIGKCFKGIIFCITTVCAKIKWGKGLKISGILKKRIDTQFIISKGSRLRIGKYVGFFKNVAVSAMDGGEFCIGNNVMFNRNCIAICRKQITIGDDVAFGPGVLIYDHDHCFGANGLKDGFTYSPIIIEEHCWIGAGCVILKGTHIGKNCVIGAGCVIKGDIPPNSLVTSDRTIKIKPLENRE